MNNIIGKKRKIRMRAKTKLMSLEVKLNERTMDAKEI